MLASDQPITKETLSRALVEVLHNQGDIDHFTCLLMNSVSNQKCLVTVCLSDLTTEMYLAFQDSLVESGALDNSRRPEEL